MRYEYSYLTFRCLITSYHIIPYMIIVILQHFHTLFLNLIKNVCILIADTSVLCIVLNHTLTHKSFFNLKGNLNCTMYQCTQSSTITVTQCFIFIHGINFRMHALNFGDIYVQKNSINKDVSCIQAHKRLLSRVNCLWEKNKEKKSQKVKSTWV